MKELGRVTARGSVVRLLVTLSFRVVEGEGLTPPAAQPNMTLFAPFERFPLYDFEDKCEPNLDL